MHIFIDIICLAAGWAAGLIIFGMMVEHLRLHKVDGEARHYLMICGLFLIVAATLGIVAVLDMQCFLFLLGGYLISLVQVIDPMKLTQEKAEEIGRKAAREAALKEQKEEQKREDERIKAENARIYSEAKKANAKKK